MFDIEGIAQMVNIAIVEDEAMYAKQLQEFLLQYQKEIRSYTSTSHSLILF